MPISFELANEIYYIELWHILSLLFFAVVNYYIYLKANKTTLLYTYLLTQAMIIVWIIAKIFKTISPTIDLRWLFIVVQYFGASFLGPCLLIFAYMYTKRKLPKPLTIIFLFIPAIYCFCIVATNPIHFKFYSKMTFYSDSFGYLFYINMAISYIYIISSMYFLSRGFFKMFGNAKKRAYLFAGAIIIPFIMNILYITKMFKMLFGHNPLFDYTPIATNASLIFFAIAAMKYRFFDMLPIAKRQIFECLSDAFAICDNNLNIFDYNTKLMLLFPNIANGYKFDISSDKTNIDEKVYKVFKIKDKDFTVFRFTDITKIDNMLSEIQNKNEELSQTKSKLEQMLLVKKKLIILNAGIYILQELHDILGHATVLAISACEVEILNNANTYKDTLFEIKKTLSESHSELKHTLISEENNYIRTSLIIAIDSIIKKSASSRIKVEQTIQGTPFEFNNETSQAVLRIYQEAITNTLKHSNANELHIILRYNENDFELFIMDNGNGCDKIIFGKGLSGMQKRIQEIGAMIEFSSDIECGFRIYAKIERN